MTGRPARFAHRASRTQVCGEFAIEATARLDVEGLVDGLGRHPHLRFVGKVDLESASDLFRTFVTLEPSLDLPTQQKAGRQLRVAPSAIAHDRRGSGPPTPCIPGYQTARLSSRLTVAGSRRISRAIARTPRPVACNRMISSRSSKRRGSDQRASHRQQPHMTANSASKRSRTTVLRTGTQPAFCYRRVHRTATISSTTPHPADAPAPPRQRSSTLSPARMACQNRRVCSKGPARERLEMACSCNSSARCCREKTAAECSARRGRSGDVHVGLGSALRMTNKAGQHVRCASARRCRSAALRSASGRPQADRRR